MKLLHRARVTTFVGVEPGEAFEVFTAETDRWWRQGLRFRFAPTTLGKVAFEGGPDSRLIERFEDGQVLEIGRVLVWEPGARLVFEWRGRNFAPNELSEVEVRFEPKNEGTEVTIEHRGSPALFGNRAFTDMLGLWWGDVVTSYRAYIAQAGAAQSKPSLP